MEAPSLILVAIQILERTLPNLTIMGMGRMVQIFVLGIFLHLQLRTRFLLSLPRKHFLYLTGQPTCTVITIISTFVHQFRFPSIASTWLGLGKGEGSCPITQLAMIRSIAPFCRILSFGPSLSDPMRYSRNHLLKSCIQWQMDRPEYPTVTTVPFAILELRRPPVSRTICRLHLR